MWVFTKYGFVSVVEDYRNPMNVMVRSRDRSHLDGLITHLRLRVEISTTENTDYPHRIVVPKKAWARCMAKLTQGIDYTNFKDEVHRNRSRRSRVYLSVLYDVWLRVAEAYR